MRNPRDRMPIRLRTVSPPEGPGQAFCGYSFLDDPVPGDVIRVVIIHESKLAEPGIGEDRQKDENRCYGQVSLHFGLHCRGNGGEATANEL